MNKYGILVRLNSTTSRRMVDLETIFISPNVCIGVQNLLRIALETNCHVAPPQLCNISNPFSSRESGACRELIIRVIRRNLIVVPHSEASPVYR